MSASDQYGLPKRAALAGSIARLPSSRLHDELADVLLACIGRSRELLAGLGAWVFLPVAVAVWPSAPSAARPLAFSLGWFGRRSVGADAEANQERLSGDQ
ncbi:hypothetical protein [Pseudomonas sp. MBLB4136]|uniref:hypothetical protein n=1 Tax=Pseudomonas sp. MBLB4136 TaxID=3451558 RepID=UPI003F753550